MKKSIICILAIMGSYVQASTYYAKVEPHESFIIKSDISGKVSFSDTQKEGSFIQNKIDLIKIDDDLNQKNLISIKNKINFLQEILKISQENLKNLQENEKIREDRYNKYLTLSTKSSFEKENEFVNYINAKNQTLSMLEKIENTKIQINDLIFQKESLEDTIAKKSISVSNLYINKINIKKDDFVSLGTALLEGYDTSKAKLTIFISKEDLEKLSQLSFYIDDKLVENPKYKVWSVADVQNISAYKCEIIIDKPKYFSKLAKIELK